MAKRTKRPRVRAAIGIARPTLRPGTRSVVQSRIQHQIGLHVPFEVVHDRSCAADAFQGGGIIAHLIGDDIPMPGRSFRMRTISPEFGQNPSEIATLDEVGSVWSTRAGIDRVSLAIVRSKGIVAECSWRDVDEKPVFWRQFAASLDDFNNFRTELGVAYSA